ncbi:O-antigen ligase family protein [Acidovorax sp. NCPPB 2350]|nr:O-antigen ligase family protein [Acidovorax sp. NCPPB 2350]
MAASPLSPPRAEFFTRLSCAAAFMVPGIALWVRSGYSWGAALLLLASLATATTWLRRPPGRQAWWLFASMALMGAVWGLDFNAAIGIGTLDRPVKYLLALPCLFYVLAYPPRAAWLIGGVGVGAAGAGLIGIHQTLPAAHGWFLSPGPYFPRASGFTNPIQYGGISLLLALMASVALVALWERWKPWQRAAWIAAVLLGVEGALLSESRGSWVVLPIALPVCVWLQARCGRRRVALAGAALVIAGAGVLMALKADEVRTRVTKAQEEVTQFEASGEAENSVGQRLAHWKLAWQMGMDRPLLGWGRYGYEVEKRRRVEAGLAHPYLLNFTHAHNEVLDIFAKRGLMGVGVLLLFYGVPLALFWPTRRRVGCAAAGPADSEALCLRMMGVLVPLSYMGFGVTQVFLGHNSGTMFYLFMNMVLLAILQGRERRPA